MLLCCPYRFPSSLSFCVMWLSERVHQLLFITSLFSSLCPLLSFWLLFARLVFPRGSGGVSQRMENTAPGSTAQACAAYILLSLIRLLSLTWTTTVSGCSPVTQNLSESKHLWGLDVFLAYRLKYAALSHPCSLIPTIWNYLLYLPLIVHLHFLFKVPNSLCVSLSVLLREEVAQLQEEVHLLRQMKDMLNKDLEDTQGGCSANLLSATELRVQLGDKEQELDRAKEALQGRSHLIHQGPCSPTPIYLPEDTSNKAAQALRKFQSVSFYHRVKY